MTENQPVDNEASESDAPAWQPLDDLQRRVLGVLVEKAKTTPDSYPLTVNSIKTACNQKSNRNPVMDLDADDVMATLDELRAMGAVGELQGDGRTSKYRHKAYEWLGVDKFELAVITELMLRGDQTVGELRARAARMEPIDGLAELKPVLERLKAKRLLVEVTPAGRGQIVTHGLYQEGEQPTVPTAAVGTASSSSQSSGASVTSSTTRTGAGGGDTRLEQLQEQLDKLERRVADLEARTG